LLLVSGHSICVGFINLNFRFHREQLVVYPRLETASETIKWDVFVTAVQLDLSSAAFGYFRRHQHENVSISEPDKIDRIFRILVIKVLSTS